MLFCNIDILDKDLQRKANQYVGVQDNSITYIGSQKPEGDYGEEYDGRNKLLMPGLINAHGHSVMTLLRGYAENLPLQRWLQEMVWPFEGNITNERALPSARLAMAEMLRFGTTSFSDMYAFDDALVTAVEESGIKCNMTHGMLAFDPEQNYWDMPECKVVDGLIERARALGDDRLKIEIGPHAEYDVCEKVMRAAAEHASQLGIGIQIHVSETQTEHEECKERHGGLTPVAYLESVGILGSPTTAAHCVWCTPDDLQILKAHDASVATCPASNLKLGSGLPNTWKFLHSGVNLAIGTDGASSNNALNMFKDMYLAAIAYRVDSDADLTVTAADVLRAATAGGAYAQRRANTGVVEVGKRADLIVLDLDLPWMQPISHIENNVVYAATGTEVVLTMVDGKICYRDGEYLGIDIERAIAETQVARDQIVDIVNYRGPQGRAFKGEL